MGNNKFEMEYLEKFTPEDYNNIAEAHEFYEHESKVREIGITIPDGRFIITDHNNLLGNYVELDPTFIDKYTEFVTIFGKIDTFFRLHLYSAYRFNVDFQKVKAFPLKHPGFGRK